MDKIDGGLLTKIFLLQSLGNHELDEGILGIIPFIDTVTTPVLAANLILDKVPEMQNISNLYPSVTLNVNENKIGIIGYLTAETKFLAPDNNIEYEDEVIAIRREVKRLKSHGVKIFIALGHSGFIKDLEIARDVEDLDLVIGGHSNTFLWNGNFSNEKPEYPQGEYPTLVKQPSGRKVPVVQAYAFTKYLGKLHLIFDSDGEILEYDGNPILLNQSVLRDPDLLEIVNNYAEKVEAVSSEVFGTSMTHLDGDSCRIYECNMGNFITDVTVQCTKDHDEKYSDINIAFIQGGRIRASIFHDDDPFEMTWGDWITVLPFPDNLVIVTMNGSVLKQAMEHSVAKWNKVDRPGQFLQFSGLNVTYDLGKLPGSRLVEIKAITPNGNYENVKDDSVYKVLMNFFLTDNGDGYTMFKGLEREFVPYSELSCIIEFLKTSGPINPKTDNRLNILNEDKLNQIFSEIAKGTTEKSFLISKSVLEALPSQLLLLSTIALLLIYF